ncbi:MAG: hypothetical protein ACOYVF_09590 [Candidatus Zixiibacteriota bacterium]
MKRIMSFSVSFLLMATTLVFIGLGCSQDNPVDTALENTDSELVILDQTGIDQKAVTEAGSFVETFDNYSNEGGWSYATTSGYVIEQTGGNPDWYLHDTLVVSFAPHPETSLGMESIFTGNYKLRNVVSLGIDLRSFDYDGDISGRYLTLFLMNDNGTPYDVADDWGAYIIGPDKVPSKYVPMLAAAETLNAPGWVSYDFVIPSQSKRLPSGWKNWSNSMAGGSKPATGNWQTLMQDVSYVRFYYGDPTMYYILDTYDLGMDNPRISWE